MPYKKQLIKVSKQNLSAMEMFDSKEADLIIQNIEADGSFMADMQKAFLIDILYDIDKNYASNEELLNLTGWIKSNTIDKNFTGREIIGEDITLINWEIPVKADL